LRWGSLLPVCLKRRTSRGPRQPMLVEVLE
jgi:hypothetical protein